MKINTLLDDSSSEGSNRSVVFTSENDSENDFELVAFNVPSTKVYSLKNTFKRLAGRKIENNQVVFSPDGLEFRTKVAQGEQRDEILNKFLPKANPSQIFVLEKSQESP